jgi:hypothetical protein
MSKALDYIKDTLKILFGCIILTVIVLDFQDICLASRKLLEMAGAVHAIEVVGVKVDFNEAAVEHGLKMFNVASSDQKEVLESMRNLNSIEFVRLMAVGQLNDLCEYERPTPSMREDVATDYGLQQKGLTKIELSETLKEAITKRNAQEGRESLGEPHSCYEMTLTELGSNVKTVIVQNLAPAFARTQSEPSANKIAAIK